MGATIKEKKAAKCGKCWTVMMKRHRAFITTQCIIITLFIIGLLFLALGTIFIVITTNLFEQEVRYDQECLDQIARNNHTSTNCIITFNITETLEGRVILLYHLSNFYQNHRRMFLSKSEKQLKGSYLSYKHLTSCDPKITTDGSKSESKIYLPCGLAPLSFLNDTYHFVDPEMDANFSEKGISIKQERENLYKPISSSYTEGYRWLEEITPAGTTDEHFIVWMRTAAMPSFIKIFSICKDCYIKPGEYKILVKMNYPQSMYVGGRSLIIATTSTLGSGSYFISVTYFAIGGFSCIFALGCFLQLLLCPRKRGDIARIFPVDNIKSHTIDQRLTESNLPIWQSSRQQLSRNREESHSRNDSVDTDGTENNDLNNRQFIDTELSSSENNNQVVPITTRIVTETSAQLTGNQNGQAQNANTSRIINDTASSLIGKNKRIKDPDDVSQIYSIDVRNNNDNEPNAQIDKSNKIYDADAVSHAYDVAVNDGNDDNNNINTHNAENNKIVDPDDVSQIYIQKFDDNKDNSATLNANKNDDDTSSIYKQQLSDEDSPNSH